jgi:hypothetical protein
MNNSLFILLLSFGFLNAAEAPRRPLSASSSRMYPKDPLLNISELSADELESHEKRLNSVVTVLAPALVAVKRSISEGIESSRTLIDLEDLLAIDSLALDIIAIEKANRTPIGTDIEDSVIHYKPEERTMRLRLRTDELINRYKNLKKLYKQKLTAHERSASITPTKSPVFYGPSVSPTKFWTVSPKTISCSTKAELKQFILETGSWSDTDDIEQL